MSDLLAGVRNHEKEATITSKQRAHKGNVPTLPQSFSCPRCSARFTRSTHLTRHMKNHSSERQYKCQTCPAQFTRSDLLARHRRNCEDPTRPMRLRSCILCTQSKVKCDRNDPCSRCKAKGIDCAFGTPPRTMVSSVDHSLSSDPPSSSSTPSTMSSDTSSIAVNANEVSFLPLQSLSRGLTDIIPPTLPSTVHGSSAADLPLVNSHLSPVYGNDAFESLFNDVFSNSESPPSLDDMLPAFPPLEELPMLQSGAQDEPWFHELLIYPQNSIPPAKTDQRSLLNDFFSRELKAADPKHYLYLFFNTFVAQMPLVHTATFTLDHKPPYLLKAMKACGAIFVRTRKASNYITESLAAAREGLAQAFSNTSTDTSEQLYLVIAVVLLQTIGLWHQKADERAMSSLYHAMLVTMIRRSQLISKCSAWSPSKEGDVQTIWREWAFHEMTKRALLLSYLHDCCQPIYFGLPPSYFPGEVTLRMPCEDALWKAGSAQEWLSILQIPLQDSSERRLTGLDMSTSLASMNDAQFVPTPHLSRFCHFILIHAILRDLFTACSEPLNRSSDSYVQDTLSPHMLSMQYALHNWLHSWTLCTSRTRLTGELSFFDDVVPFYWLGQVAILAYQEGLPPFNVSDGDKGEVRFKMVKRWLRHIRAFLNDDSESTIFWDELMKIRLQNWQLEYDADGGLDDQDGLLGFFPDMK